MRVGVYKNLLAIRYIRCTARVPGSKQRAGGAGFTLDEALAKCESEVIERNFQVHELRPWGINPLGIGTHPNLTQARERALQEAVETLCLEKIHSDRVMNCLFKIKIGSFALGLAKTHLGYFVLIRGKTSNEMFAAHSAGTSFLSTLLKTWEEFQSVLFFRPRGARLKKFTRANFLFSKEELKSLGFVRDPKSQYQPTLENLTEEVSERSGRKIVYFIQKGGIP